MAKDKDKHPSWFKMKLERRELVRQLSPETNVINLSPSFQSVKKRA